MNVKILIALSLLVAASCHPGYYKILDMHANKGAKEQFKIWHFLNEKSYELNSEEALSRYRIFKANMAYIKKVNAEDRSYKLGLGPFADKTDEELDEMLVHDMEDMIDEDFTRNLRAVNFDEAAAKIDAEKAPLPRRHPNIRNNCPDNDDNATIDWAPNWPHVRNQGTCGSCWAFATASTIEGWAVNFGFEFIDLSPQHLVDCDTKNKGCNGGWYNAAFKFVEVHGIAAEKQYPYKAKKGTCGQASGNGECNGSNKAAKSVLKTEGTQFCCKTRRPSKTYNCTEDKLRGYLDMGPFATAVEVTRDWYKYKSGLLDTPCPKRVNHAVVVTQFSKTHIKIRNSWGGKWGENGYARIKRDAKNNGSCFIEQYAYAPTAVMQP